MNISKKRILFKDNTYIYITNQEEYLVKSAVPTRIGKEAWRAIVIYRRSLLNIK